MDSTLKKIYPIASSYPLIKVAWFISQKLNVKLIQRSLGDSFSLIFFEFDQNNTRIRLFNLRELQIKQLKNFDYLLVLENYLLEDIQKLRDSNFINFITELNPEDLTKKSREFLLSL